MVGRERTQEVESLLRRVTDWARGRTDVRALALVGSWAYGAPRDDSDVDLLLLTDAPERYLLGDDWLADVGGVRLVRTLDWGGVTERRIALPSGLEVEFGIGAPAWASEDPLDDGTHRVASDGMRVLHDPDGLLGSLLARLLPGGGDPGP